MLEILDSADRFPNEGIMTFLKRKLKELGYIPKKIILDSILYDEYIDSLLGDIDRTGALYFYFRGIPLVKNEQKSGKKTKKAIPRRQKTI